jgi:hypothetical protein
MRIRQRSLGAQFSINPSQTPVRVGSIFTTQAREIFQAAQGTRNRLQSGGLQVFQGR